MWTLASRRVRQVFVAMVWSWSTRYFHVCDFDIFRAMNPNKPSPKETEWKGDGILPSPLGEPLGIAPELGVQSGVSTAFGSTVQGNLARSTGRSHTQSVIRTAFSRDKLRNSGNFASLYLVWNSCNMFRNMFDNMFYNMILLAHTVPFRKMTRTAATICGGIERLIRHDKGEWRIAAGAARVHGRRGSLVQRLHNRLRKLVSL